MEVNSLNAISPIDGRYRSKVEQLGEFFSEQALIKYRLFVEIEYLIALMKSKAKGLKPLSSAEVRKVKSIYKNFNSSHAIRIKEIESVTNHDVKAVEYFLKEEMEKLNIDVNFEFIHFGLTSQDINNTSFPLMLKDAHESVYLPQLIEVTQKIGSLYLKWKKMPMLSRTHGQPASPTTMGKEMKVFHERLNKQLVNFSNIVFTGKFGGATGSLNAHKVSYPKTDWERFSNDFLRKSLGLKRQTVTTQIEHYDQLAELFHNYIRINTILLDFVKDIWAYVSMEYFKQKINKNEVGSSAMPHKVNPIDFENAEGNLGIANCLFEHLATKLPISRLQRDLTDSTVLRNIGVPLAHTSIALNSIDKGLSKLIINENKMNQDLEENWIVIAEAIQNILRREGYDKPYEKLKELTRTNKKINKTAIHKFIDSLNVSASLKKELKKISPHNYTGYASE